MILEHRAGDIALAPINYAIVHAVSQCGALSAGLANYLNLLFNLRPEFLSQPRSCPDVVLMKRSQCGSQRIILNVVTKQNKADIPTPLMVFEALKTLREFLLKNNILNIAIPEFSTGLDKLDYDMLIHFINLVFEKTPIYIIMYHLLPSDQIKSAPLGHMLPYYRRSP